MFYFFVWCIETSFLSVLWQILSQTLTYLHSHLKYIYLKSKKTSVRKKKKETEKTQRDALKLNFKAIPSLLPPVSAHFSIVEQQSCI